MRFLQTSHSFDRMVLVPLLAAAWHVLALRAQSYGQKGEGTGFPHVDVKTFDPRQVHPDARRFQLADYDAKRNRVIFYPEGDFPFPLIEWHPTALGTILTYSVSEPFTSASSYRAYDLTRIVSADAGGFCGGFIDQAGDSAYLVPLYKIVRDEGAFRRPNVLPNGLAVKIDLRRDLNSPEAYQTFDIATLGFSPIGYCDGAEANGYVYYGPVGGRHFGGYGGVLLRQDTRQSFSSRSSWQWFDMKRIHPDAIGFQAVAYIAPHIYLVHYFRSILVRYDTRQPFESPAAYEALDATRITPEPLGLCGAVVVGKNLLLVPWDDPKRLRAISTALLYDSTKPLQDASSWRSVDLKRVDPNAGGYQFGWVDKNGYVWLVPDKIVFRGVPPLITWNSRLPFEDPQSWHVYPTVGIIPPSTGAAYDPHTNRAWLSPYGSRTDYSIAQIDISSK